MAVNTGAGSAEDLAAAVRQALPSNGPWRLACDGETFDGSDEVDALKTGSRVVLYSTISE